MVERISSTNSQDREVDNRSLRTDAFQAFSLESHHTCSRVITSQGRYCLGYRSLKSAQGPTTRIVLFGESGDCDCDLLDTDDAMIVIIQEARP